MCWAPEQDKYLSPSLCFKGLVGTIAHVKDSRRVSAEDKLEPRQPWHAMRKHAGCQELWPKDKKRE